MILDLVAALHEQTRYGFAFSVPSADYYATDDSCGAGVSYRHDWLATGRFGLQVSFQFPPFFHERG